MERQPDSYDFNDLVSSLQLYLSSTAEFKGVNWKGSTAARMAALLAYNTSINAAGVGFSLGESSLASATVRRSAAMKASGQLNYLPASQTCSRLTVDLKVAAASVFPAATITLDRRVAFSGISNSVPLNFVPDTSYTANLVRGAYHFSGVNLLQGNRTTQSYTVKTSFNIETYEILDKNIDTKTLLVSVKESDGILRPYTRYTHPRQLTAGARLYYIRVAPSGNFAIEFGDDVFSRRVKYSEVIVTDFISTNGTEGNGAANVIASGSIRGLTDIQVVVTSGYSVGGSGEEDLDSIKRLAPLRFGMTGGCITAADFGVEVKNFLGTGSSVASWGGEENVPPKYGYTFIAAKTADADTLTTQQKIDLKAYLQSLAIGSITPIIQDGIFTYIKANVVTSYIKNNTVLNKQQLQDKIINSLKAYSASTLEKFDIDFVYQDFSKYLLAIDPSMTMASATLSFFKIDSTISLNIPQYAIYNFNFAIAPGSVVISGFKPLELNSDLYTYQLVEDANSKLIMMRILIAGGTSSQFPGTYGSVDHTTGIVTLSGLIAASVTTLRIECTNPAPDQSVAAVRDSLFKIQELTCVATGK